MGGGWRGGGVGGVGWGGGRWVGRELGFLSHSQCLSHETLDDSLSLGLICKWR